MIAPTRIYDHFPTITPAQAADLVVAAMVGRPHELNTLLGNLGAVAHTVAPRATFRVPHLAYRVFPDSAAARGDEEEAALTPEQQLLARLLKGVHWWDTRQQSRSWIGTPDLTDPRPHPVQRGRPRLVTPGSAAASPVATGRSPACTHWLHDPGYNAARRPRISSASTSCAAVTPEPQ